MKATVFVSESCLVAGFVITSQTESKNEEWT